MFRQHELSYGGTSGTATLSLTDAIVAPPSDDHTLPWRDRWQAAIHSIDLVPDLGCDIGSRSWWRGVATLIALIIAAVATAPGMGALPGASGPLLDANDWEMARAQAIMPLAYGGDTGLHMAATDSVQPLASSPERPHIELTATLGQGDGFERVLLRSGVGEGDAATIANLVASAIPLGDLESGTRLDLELGRRMNKALARPVDALALRARFDLRLEIERVDGALTLHRIPIAVDTTPLRIRGRVGDSLYRSARAAGAPAKAIEAYLKVLATQLSVGRDIGADDQFDIIIDYRRAETGEAEAGNLIFAGLDRASGKDLRMLAWTQGGRQQWFEASGVGQSRQGMAAPVHGRLSSHFGMRRHPILGYVRMHSGNDYGAAYGSPIFAVTDGRVDYAGRKGGYGNYVRVQHGGGLGSGYGHMSRIAVRSGASVKRGQVIGYVGNSGLSTGPHLHFEIYRNGRPVDPSSVRYVTRAQLEGSALAAFRAKLNSVTRVAPGAALAPMHVAKAADATPPSEADRLPG